MVRKVVQSITDFEQTSIELINNAQEEIETAQFLLNKECYRASASRSYYAVFWAVESCLALEHKRFSSHEQSLGNFNRDFIHSGVLKGEEVKDLHSKLVRCQSMRKLSDYEFQGEPFSKEEAKEQLELAKEIVSCVARNYKQLKENKVIKENAYMEDKKQESKNHRSLLPKPSKYLLEVIKAINKESGVPFKGKTMADAKQYILKNGQKYLEEHPEINVNIEK